MLDLPEDSPSKVMFKEGIVRHKTYHSEIKDLNGKFFFIDFVSFNLKTPTEININIKDYIFSFSTSSSN